MPLVINSNPLAQFVQRNFGKANRLQTDAMRRLSSGLRINSAKDDPAGLTKSNRIQTEIRSQNKVLENLYQGLSYAQFADATLEEIGNLIQRGRELALQAANSTISDSDRQSLNAEFLETKEQIDKLAEASSMFGRYPLGSGNLETPYTVPTIAETFEPYNLSWIKSFVPTLEPLARIPKGTTDLMLSIWPKEIDGILHDIDIQIFTADGKHIIGTDISDITWKNNLIDSTQKLEETIISTKNGFSKNAEYDQSNLIEVSQYGIIVTDPRFEILGMKIRYTGDADRVSTFDGNNDGFLQHFGICSESINIDKVTEDLLVFVTGSGEVTSWSYWDHMPEGSNSKKQQIPLQILANTTSHSKSDFLEIKITPANIADLGLQSVHIFTNEEAGAALTKLDEALQITASHRGYYGATMKALEGRISATVASRESNSASLSRILDADFSSEVAEVTKANILQQVGASIMAQANTLPQISLELLKM